MQHQPALVLNTDGIPLRVISWKRAICLDILGKEIPEEGITVLKYYDDYVRSAGGLEIQIPAVGMTNRYINVSKKIPLTKHNLMVRDKGRCQYCYENYQIVYLPLTMLYLKGCIIEKLIVMSGIMLLSLVGHAISRKVEEHRDRQGCH